MLPAALLAGVVLAVLVVLGVALWAMVAMHRRSMAVLMLIQDESRDLLEKALALHVRPALAHRMVPASPSPPTSWHKPPDRDREREAAHLEMVALGLDPEDPDDRFKFMERSRGVA